MDAVAVARSPSVARAEGLRWLGGTGDVARLMEEADFAVVAVPLSGQTRGLIGARELDALGPDGILVNVARGEIVREQALYEALRDRRIAGAALDVWYRYPRAGGRVHPSELPFHELPNVAMSPHVSGRSEGAREARVRFLVEQLRRLERGARLENVLAVGGRR